MTRMIQVVVCLAAIAAGLWFFTHRPVVVVPLKPDTVYIKESAKAAAVAETTKVVVTRTKTLTDSVRVNIHDTVMVKEFIIKVDTLLAQCDRCARTLADFRHRADSTIKVLRDSLAMEQAAHKACSSRRPWWFVGGLALGVAGGCRGR